MLTEIDKDFSIIEFEDRSTANVEFSVFNYPAEKNDYLKVIRNAKSEIESIEPSLRENVYVGEVCGLFPGYGLVGEETYFSVGDEVLKIGDTLTCDRIKGEYITPHNSECNFRCISFAKAANELEDACSPLKRSTNRRGYTANIKNVVMLASDKLRQTEEDVYAIPSELMELVTTEKNPEIRAKLDEMLPSELNFSTYVEIFRNLLHLEELNTLKEFQKYTHLDARFYPKAIAEKIEGKQKISFVYTMEFEGLHELRPSILGG